MLYRPKILASLASQLRGIGASFASTTEARAEDCARVDALIDVELDGVEQRFAAECVSRTPLLSELPRLEARRMELAALGAPLLLAPRVGPKIAMALIGAGWSWADGQGNYDLRAPGVRLRQSGRVDTLESSVPKLPAGQGGRRVLRWLICAYDEDNPISISALAKHIGISQVAVSKIVDRLRKLGFVGSSRGLGQVDRRGLLHEFVRQYPGAGGHINYAYTLDSPVEVARRLVDAHRASVAISADVGPDQLAAWRVPTSLIVYAREPIDLAPLGLVSAAGPGDANVHLQTPTDLSVFMGPDHPRLPSSALADPTQMYIDLQRLGGEDRLEAAARLETWILK